MKKTGFILFVFLCSFSIFNLIPIIPVNIYGDTEIYGDKMICTLNAWSCYNDMFETDFPRLLQSSLWSSFILPILLPVLITHILYVFVMRKKKNITHVLSQIIDKYEGKVMGVRNYRATKKEFNSSDFIDIKKMEDFLEEVSCGESDITPAGLMFIKEYYGFNKLAKLLYKRKALRLDFSSRKEIEQWFEEIVPMEISRFVGEAQGGLKGGETLKDELMPPKNICQ